MNSRSITAVILERFWIYHHVPRAHIVEEELRWAVVATVTRCKTLRYELVKRVTAVVKPFTNSITMDVPSFLGQSCVRPQP